MPLGSILQPGAVNGIHTSLSCANYPPPPSSIAFWIPPQGRWMPAAVRMPAVVRVPACHSRRFKGERPIGAATG